MISINKFFATSSNKKITQSPIPIDIKSQSKKPKYAKLNNLIYEQIDICLNLAQSEHKSSNSYGFIIAGYCPCHVETVVENSISHNSGLKKGDLIMKINDVNCCRARIKSILSLIKNNQNSLLKLTVYRRLLDSQKAYKLAKKINLTKNSNFSIKKNYQIEKMKSKNINLISKLLRPAKWLSCAQPSNTTMSSTYIYNNASEQTKCLSLIEPNEYILCSKECCAKSNKKAESIEKIVRSDSAVDTGYETLSRYGNESNERVIKSIQNLTHDEDFTIETVIDTTNSYSECDLTIEGQVKTVRFAQQENFNSQEKISNEKFNEYRTKLIGDLLELEANFVSYLSIAVSTFSRPLRGFFIQQQDYFTLFQNIEKILVISENFLRSMDKWSAYDLYTKIGQLYAQKISLFKEAFAIYVRGYSKSKALLNELKSHSKQFRLFLNEAESGNLTLSNMIDLPVVHMQKTLNLVKEIRMFTNESKRNPSEAPQMDSVIVELKKILNNLNANKLEINFDQIFYNNDIFYDDEEEYTFEEDSTSFFMETSNISSINEEDTETFTETDTFSSQETISSY